MSKLERQFDISRDSSEYEASVHVHRRVNERTMVDYDIIEEAIEDGEVVEVQEDDHGMAAVLHYDWLRSTFKVVVDFTNHRVQTAHELEEA